MTPSTPVTLHEDVHQKRPHRHTVTPGEIAIGVIIGRTSEYFDFFVYAIASVLVFPKLIFTNLDALHGTIYSFAIFAFAFIARPIGSIIFTAIDRQFGRTSKLTIALFMLGGSTAAIAFLPGYEQIGNWSAILLSILRIGQGLALGGSWDGLPSLLSLSAPPEKRGSYAMIPQLGAPFGLIVASGLFAYFLGSLGISDFLEWGWRYPFFVAFAINVVALFSRLRIVATPEYEELFASEELQPSPIGETIRHQGFTIWLGAFAPLASFALFHMVTLFPLSWVFIFTKQEPVRFLVIEMITALLGVIAIVASGPIANRVGRRMLLVVSAIAIGFYSGYAPQFLDRGEIGQIIYMAVGFILLGISFGQSSGAVADAFPINYRYTASALTADLAWMFGAGFAPVVALVLTDQLGLPAAGGYLLSGALWTLLALWLQRYLEDRAH